jgi:hypothetical protein
MKRFSFSLALAVVLYLSGGLAYAQHGHGAGGAVGGVGGLGAHGESGSHGNAGDSGTTNSPGTAPKTASSQLMNNQPLNEALTKALEKKNLLPSGGLATACTGYTNLGRCISAIHVANNLKLPGGFFCLRRAMTGTALPSADTTACAVTQTNLKLGQAIQKFDPNADPKAEATKGTKQADTDIDTASHSQT